MAQSKPIVRSSSAPSLISLDTLQTSPPPPMTEDQMKSIEHILEYRFRNPKLIEEAITHPSFYYPAECPTIYQRLEYLGDALLSFAVAHELFKTYSDLQPGCLTLLRAANVDNEKLAKMAVKFELHSHLRYNAPQLETQICNFVKDMDQYMSHSKGLLDTPKSLGDAIESLLGAVYVDSDRSYDTVWKIFKRLAEPFITLETLDRHPISELNELCQKHGKQYNFDKCHWDKDNTIDVLIDGEIIGKATYGTRKDICQNRAAKVVLDKLKKEWNSFSLCKPIFKSSLSQKNSSSRWSTPIRSSMFLPSSLLSSLSPPPLPMPPSEINAIQQILYYQFSNPKLVEEAMTHPSFYYPLDCATTFHRLGFLGDAFLNFAVAQELFMTYRDLQPGSLTQLRAANVDNEKLARMAVGSGLHLLLRHNAPKLEIQIDNFIQDIEQYPAGSKGLLDTPRFLGDVIESLIGAIFIDSNSSHDTAWEIFKRLGEPFVTPDTLDRNPISELNELCQKHCKEYNFDKDHWDEDNTIDVLIDGEIVGKATYETKKDICQNRAAKNALDRLKKECELGVDT